jgi:hypothetical protein
LPQHPNTHNTLRRSPASACERKCEHEEHERGENANASATRRRIAIERWGGYQFKFKQRGIRGGEELLLGSNMCCLLYITLSLQCHFNCFEHPRKSERKFQFP